MIESKRNIDIEILSRLYNDEINFELSSFWDEGYYVNLGDKTNGYVWEGNYDKLKDCMFELAKQAFKHYPNSKFAKWIKEERYYSIYKKVK